jgi:photosystem II stability/assembly factor-like uncharacterized protein
MIKKVTLTLPLMLLFLHLMYASVGMNWVQVLPTSAGGIWSIRVHPTNSDIIYAASNTTGVWKSDDHGVSFAQFNGGLTNLNLQCIAMCRDNPDVLYVGTGTVAASSRGVFVTTNGGDLWTFRSTGINQTPITIQALAVDPSNPNVAYIADWDGAGVVTDAIYKTTNMGVSWTVVNTGLHTGKPILSLAVDWNTTSNVYAGSSFVSPDGPTYIYKSTNGAASWFVSSNGLDTSVTTVNPVRALSISTVNPQIILAGFFCNSGAPDNGSAWLSTNGGALWTQIRNGLPHGAGQQIRSTFIRWGHDREFWLGYDSPDSGCVYKTTNAGQTWTLYNGGSLLAGNTIRGLWGSSTHMYAGVSLGAAVGMHHNDEPPIGIIGQNGNIPQTFALLQNFPNPFNPATYIQYDIPKESFVTLRVFDVAGKEVRLLVNETKRAGSYQIMFDASSLPSGVYFYRITAGDFSDTKKMMLVK